MNIKMSAEEEAVVARVVEMVASGGSQSYKWDHPDVANMLDDLRKARVRHFLTSDPHYIVVRVDPHEETVSMAKIGGGAPVAASATTAEPKKEKKPLGFKKHTYKVPHFHDDVKAAIQDQAGLVVCGVGPTGCGKTDHMRLMAAELDMELVLINCRKDMETAGFTGEKTVEPDAETKAAVIKFMHGPVVNAMRTGLDKDGNETGRPALLVVDEFPVLPSWIAISLNNLLECAYPRRKMTLPENGGEVVMAHSGFRIVLLGNTIGRGTSMATAEHTAQGDALDISTLDRINCIFNYGYNRKAEESVLLEKFGDDKLVRKVIKLRDALRAARKQNGMRTPFSTRLLVGMADEYRVFGDIGKAFVYGVLNKTLAEEKPVYTETFFQVFGIRIESLTNNPEMDYDN